MKKIGSFTNCRDLSGAAIGRISGADVSGEQNVEAASDESFETICPGKRLSVLVFRDSFFTAVQPYFSQYFGRVKYIWRRMS
jgi:hypothetical protein